jgi:outer membrane immunogenic protein
MIALSQLNSDRLGGGRFVLAAVAALAAAAPAMAADLAPTYKAAPPATTFSWTGLYFGATVGGGMAALPVTDVDQFNGNFNGPVLKSGGWVGGVHAGYNWQFAPSFLVGLEGDFNWSNIKASDTSCLGFCNASAFDRFVASSQLDSFSSFRARFGLTSDRTLVYVTGGPAYGHIKASMTDLACSACTNPGSVQFLASDSSNHWGVAVGAGVEYALTENWILRGEYMYLDFSAKNFLWTSGTVKIDPSSTGSRASSTATAEIARVGVSYKLW